MPTVTAIVAAFARLPAASRAVAASWWAVGGGGGVPTDAVGRRRILCTERLAVEGELDAGDADVVGRVCGDGDRADEGCVASGAVSETVGGVVSGWWRWRLGVCDRDRHGRRRRLVAGAAVRRQADVR